MRSMRDLGAFAFRSVVDCEADHRVVAATTDIETGAEERHNAQEAPSSTHFLYADSSSAQSFSPVANFMLSVRSLGKAAVSQCRGSFIRSSRPGQLSRASAQPQSVAAKSNMASYLVSDLTKDQNQILTAADIVLDAFSYDDDYSMSRALGAPREGFPIWMR